MELLRPESVMSSVWEEAYDEASGRAYYFNRLYAHLALPKLHQTNAML